MEPTWDCIVVGAGAAGLSAALVLGRARRRTLVVDAGEQSNRPADGIGGLLGHDRRPPEEFYALGRENVLAVPDVELRDGTVAERARARTTRSSSSSATARPRSPAGCCSRPAWTIGSPTCPGSPSAGAARSSTARSATAGSTATSRWACSAPSPTAALLLRMWTDDVTLLTNGEALDPEEAEKLDAAGIPIDARPISHLEGPGDALSAVVFEDGERRALLRPARPRRAAPARPAGRPARRAVRRARDGRRRRRWSSTPSAAPRSRACSPPATPPRRCSPSRSRSLPGTSRARWSSAT